MGSVSTAVLPGESLLIGIVEDEQHIAEALLFNLQAEGFRTHHETDGDAAMQWLLSDDADAERPDALLLDVMLPGRDGFSLVRALRERQDYTPVMMLTARGRTEDVVEGFEAGADDYLAKPFDLAVLLARLAALLRRTRRQTAAARAADEPASAPAALPDLPAGGAFHFSHGEIDFDALELRADGNAIRLTLMEAELLRYLTEHSGQIVSRKQLLENVWHVHEDTDTRAIDNFIVRLRRYMEPYPSSPVHLLTVRGVGYRFVPYPSAG